MQKHSIHTLKQLKSQGEKFTCLTAYDATMAHVISTCGVETILTGDSLGMVIQGKSSTVSVTMAEMIYHTRCVAKGNQNSLLISDMPYMSYATENQTMTNASKLMQAGADVVKLEGGQWLCPCIRLLTERGIPSCIHLGLTPQSVSMLGGYKVQGRDAATASQIIEDAVLLCEAGAAMLVLECVPQQLAREVARAVPVPVIGIGAGPDTDGQVLVTQDMLGLTPGKKLRFVKNFMAEAQTPQAAIAAFVQAVKEKQFPDHTQSFE